MHVSVGGPQSDTQLWRACLPACLPPSLLLMPVQCGRPALLHPARRGQHCTSCACSSVQDAAKLQPGAFYLDRQPQPKHLPLAGTKYTAADVDALWRQLEAMATPAMPAAAAGGNAT